MPLAVGHTSVALWGRPMTRPHGVTDGAGAGTMCADALGKPRTRTPDVGHQRRRAIHTSTGHRRGRHAPPQMDTGRDRVYRPGSSALAATPAAAQRPAGTVATVVVTVPLTRPGTVQRGTAVLTLNAGSGQVCYRLTTAHLAPVLAAHIHVGGAGVDGPIVIPIFGYSPPRTWTIFTGCVHAAPATLTAILRAPAAYYVNVHTTPYPAGAIRGQLQATSSPDGHAGRRPPPRPDGLRGLLHHPADGPSPPMTPLDARLGRAPSRTTPGVSGARERGLR